MLNVCGTSAAGLKSRFPGCDAVIVQLPAPVRWTFPPVTVQLPLAAYETARPELEVAPSAKSGSPKVRPASGAKVSVWFCLTAESGSGQTWAPRLRVQAESVVPPRSICMSQTITLGRPLSKRYHL